MKYFFSVLSMNLKKRKGSTDASSMVHWTDVGRTHNEPFNFVVEGRRSLKGDPFGYLSFIPGVMQTDMLTESQKSKFRNRSFRTEFVGLRPASASVRLEGYEENPS